MIPKHRLLVTKDVKTPEVVGGLILPTSFRPTCTGTVVESGVADIKVGDHVAWDSQLPSLPEIELNGKPYLSIHERDIKIIHQKHQTS
jgi:co-chaperonin GroES (HSP10)